MHKKLPCLRPSDSAWAQCLLVPASEKEKKRVGKPPAGAGGLAEGRPLGLPGCRGPHLPTVPTGDNSGHCEGLWPSVKKILASWGVFHVEDRDLVGLRAVEGYHTLET